MCLSALSCTQESVITMSSDITSIKFGPEGGSFNTILFSNCSWTAGCDDEAVTISPASGTYTTPLHIEVGENTEHFTKAIRITFDGTLDGKARVSRIVVTQDCHPFVVCENDSATIGSEGGVVNFQVNSNVPWVYYGTLLDGVPCENLQAEPYSWKENLVTMRILVPGNTGGMRRTFVLLLSFEEGGQYEECERLTIVQN